ncbi:MAG: gliding motility-associated C-terminal domain-containing protein, partial [Bacteroidetes bacterium]|nr:gliding motility-associated C-terminal domain-containing protein [Bacteroidota bacterium]
ATCFGYNDGKAYIDSISGGFLPYTYAWDATAANQTTDTAFNLTQGTYSVTVTDNSNCSFTKSITVEQALEIQLSETHTNITCNGETTGNIDVSVVNGIMPFTYAWTGPSGFTANTEDINNLGAGTYSLTFTDAKGCQDTISATITEPTALSLNVSSTNITCKDLDNGTATVTTTGGSPNYTYAWNGGTNPSNNAVTGLAPGTYQVVVTDANGCQDSISTQPITEPDSLLLTVDNITNVSCNGGNDGAINVSTQGGTPNYTYSWTNSGGSNEDLANAAAGTYALTVTDVNNCTYTVTETVTEPTAIQINLSKTDIDCFGASTGAIDATVSGGTVATSYTYAWSSSNGFTANTEDINNVATGTYTLTITDDNNCTETATVTLNQPATVEIAIDMTPVNCFGGNDGTLTASVTAGGTAPFAYQWDANAGNQTGATASNLSAGTYTVEVTDANNCTYTESATVTQPSAPLSLTIDSTDISCAGYDDGTATVVATGGTPNYTYSWTNANGQTSATVTNLGSGAVSVTVTDANNCTQTISTTINEPTPLVLIATPDSANCWGENSGSISLTASGGTGFGYLYSINNGVDFQNDTVFTGLSAGVYNQIVVQDLGSSTECISQPIQTIVDQPDYFTFNINPADTTLQLSETVSLELVIDSPYTVNDITAISWNPTEGLNCTDCINPEVLSYEHYTEYEALVSYIGDDEVWCTQTSTTVIQVENNLNLFIPNAFTPSSFDNVNSTFQIYGEGIEAMEMKVFNRWGEMIFYSTNQLDGWDGTYKGKDQNPGVYSYYVYVKYLDNKEVKRKGS